jgi:hypothetical protein
MVVGWLFVMSLEAFLVVSDLIDLYAQRLQTFPYPQKKM